MKLLFASDSFKGSLTSAQTLQLLKQAAIYVFGSCETVGLQVADGGEGTVDAILHAEKGERITACVHDPLMRTISADYGIFDRGKAIIEMSAASGLPLVEENLRDPRNTSTFGTGELILDALAHGVKKIYIAIGGSATNDGGIGCMQALGMRFLDQHRNPLAGTGSSLGRIAHIDSTGLDQRLRDCSITILSDVMNPLCGEKGATFVYGKQKGATPEILEELEKGMLNYNQIIQQEYGIDCSAIPGAGAAGGLGAALKIFCNGIMQSGIETVLDLIHFDSCLDGVDLVVTGEGRTDGQSCYGKVIQGVGMRAKAKGVQAVCLSGSMGDNATNIYDYGISSIMTTVNAPMSLHEALADAEALYLNSAIRMFRFIQIGMRIKD